MKLDVLAFGPHRDDVELSCGGTLIKLSEEGYTVGVVDMTRGEMGTRGSAAERAREAERAAEIMGLAVRENLGLPDANVRPTDEAQLAAVRTIRKYRPRIILLPPPDAHHPDHDATSEMVRISAFKAGLSKYDPESGPKHIAERLVYYMMRYEFEPTFVVDITDQHERKLEAVQAYVSQVHNPDYRGEAIFLSSPEYLEIRDVRDRYWGNLVGRGYGEPFYTRELHEVRDLVAECGGRDDRGFSRPRRS